MAKYKFKKNIVFKSNGEEHFLFQLMNFGKEKDELKFIFNDQSYNTSIIHSKTKLTLDASTLINRQGEATYHNDGSFMLKFPNFPIKSKQYFNPKEEGFRRTPLSDIENWEPLFKYNIYDYSLCRKKKLIKENEKFTLINDHLFDGNSFSCLINIVNKNYNVPQIIDFDQISIKIESVTEYLDLWLVIAPLVEKGYTITLQPKNIQVFSTNNILEAMEKV